MRTLCAVLFFFLVYGGGVAALKTWGVRQYARRTGDSFLDSLFGNWFGERLWRVPVGVWMILWLVLGMVGTAVICEW